MPRIFLPLSEPSNTIKITGDKARYLTTVLRCGEGDDLVILDGRGTLFKTIIKNITKKEILTEVIDVIQCDTESRLNIILIQGILKGEKMDLIIQKTAELGIKEIIPAITERSQVRKTQKIERWKKIAEDASRQCGRTMVPIVHEYIPFDDLFSDSSTVLLPYPKGFIFWEEGGLPLKEAVLRISPSPKPPLSDSSLYILVGPEGGFTGKEVDIAKGKGFVVASLGRRILRAETAAISATAIIQFLLGDLS